MNGSDATFDEAGEQMAGEDAEGKGIMAVLGPEGFIMLSIGFMLDLLSAFFGFLIIAFGVGLIPAKAVYFLGLVIVGAWQLVKSGGFSPRRKKKKGMASTALKKFFKKQFPKLAAKIVPFAGDIIPLWTWTIYDTLRNG